MNGELLFCKPWKHVTKMIHNQNFDVCVSDIIFGNQQETIAQYHAVIIINNKIAQLCDFSDKITEKMAEKYLINFEDGIRKIIRINFMWEQDLPDNDTVKIWYYSEKDESFSQHIDKRFFPRFRLTITVNNVININQEKSQTITDQLYEFILEWIEKVFFY